MASSTLRLLSLFTATVTAFNMDIHNQIGFMAEQHLTSQARWMTQRLLEVEPEYEGSIGRAAAWADTVSRTTHKYSYTWHWISALDNPPSTCNIYPHRDCQSTGCVTKQIANQTSILSHCAQSLVSGTHPDAGNITCAEALKWITHFIADVAQPLHTTNGYFGGNTFNVTFNGTATDMHKVWDKLIVYAMTSSHHRVGFSNKSIDSYFERLVERTRQDALPTPRDCWILGGAPTQALYWAGEWARDTNGLNCDFVYGRFVEGSDLWLDAEGAYAKGAFEILEVQMAKAAWRLGGWLNGAAAKYLTTIEAGDGMEVEEGDALVRPIPLLISDGKRRSYRQAGLNGALDEL